MLHGSPTRLLQTYATARSSRAVLACAVTAGLSFQFTAHPAQAEEATTAEAYLADLVHQLSSAKQSVDDLELEMGGLRESVNKARVDLDKAQQDAQRAQDDVTSARDRLKQSDDALSTAQSKLDDIARSAYAAGGDASPVTLAAGTDAVADTLDRSSYIRIATERQKDTVDRLDLARTQNANEESRLRANRNHADDAVAHAVQLHSDATTALATTQDALREKRFILDQLIKDRDKAQKKLDAARSAVDTLANTKPQATSFEKRQVAEAAAAKAEELFTRSSQSDSNQSPERNAAPADTQAPATPDPQAAQAQQQPIPAHTSTNTGEETNAPVPSASAASADTTPDSDSEADAVLGSVENIPTHFAPTEQGDEQRQLAINGLLRAGSAAAMAGFSTYAQGGNQQAALDAALKAGRDTAGQEFDQAQEQLRGTETTGTTPPNNDAPSDGARNETATNTEQAASNRTHRPEEAPTNGTTADALSAIGDSLNNLGNQLDGTVTAPTDSAPTGVDTSGTAEEKIERVIARGMSQLGVTYAWGGGNAYGPTLGIRDGGVADTYGDYAKVGFDCSGLTLYSFAAVGITLDHYSGSQYTAGRQVPTSEIKRGDMLFYGPGGSQHVAIYLGDGQMLEAPQSGSEVKISPVRWGGMTPMAVRMIE